jgi:hypothetical protein
MTLPLILPTIPVYLRWPAMFFLQIIAKAMAAILFIISWKRSTVRANLQHTSLLPWSQKFYFSLLNNLSYDFLIFLLGRPVLHLGVDPLLFNSLKSDFKEGGIVLSLHLCNHELMGAYLAQSGISFTASVAPMNNPFSEKLLKLLRHRHSPFTQTFTQKPRRLFECLQKKDVLGFMIDQHPGPLPSLNSLFLGQPTPILKTPFFLAHKYQLPVWFCFLSRSGHTYNLNLKKLNIQDLALSESSIIPDFCSPHIPEFVSQYYGLFHRRFKNIQPSIY